MNFNFYGSWNKMRFGFFFASCIIFMQNIQLFWIFKTFHYALDSYWSEGWEFKPKHHQADAVGPLDKSLNPIGSTYVFTLTTHRSRKKMWKEAEDDSALDFA